MTMTTTTTTTTFLTLRRPNDADLWRIRVTPRIRFQSPALMAINDAGLDMPARYYCVMWVSMMGSSEDARLAPVRITFKRDEASGVLTAESVALTQTGSTTPQKNIPYPVEQGLVFASTRPGIPSTSCLEMTLRGDVASDACMLAQTTIGSCGISLLQMHSLLKNMPPSGGGGSGGGGIVVIRAPIKLHASMDTSIATLELVVHEAYFNTTHVREVFDACMMPIVSGTVLQHFASMGWMHLPRDDVAQDELIGNIPLKEVGLKPLLPVAARAMVPYCNENSGIIPVDLFFRVHNAPDTPRPDEKHWLRACEQALWLRGLTPQQALAMCERNFKMPHFEPRFELVISACNKMFSMRASLPYRSDFSNEPVKDKMMRRGTDYFWQTESQRSGDCEDSDKTIKDHADMFMAGKWQDPLLRYMQRVAGCSLPVSVLCIVTSPSLKDEQAPKQRAAGEKHRFTPIPELECGLHAVQMMYPLAQFQDELARTVGHEAVQNIDFFGGTAITAADLPPWYGAVKLSVLEGTGNLNSRLLPMRTYVSQHLQHLAMSDPQLARQFTEDAEKLVNDTETKFRATRSILGLHPTLMESLNFKPEMDQFNVDYEYDYDAIWNGEKAPISHFYVAPVEMYTDRLMNAGHKHSRFLFTSKHTAGDTNWLKGALIDSVVVADERVGLWPQPKLTETVLKTSMMLLERMEPVSYVDFNEADDFVDAIMKRSEQMFATVSQKDTIEQQQQQQRQQLVYVDLHLQNGQLRTASRIPVVDRVASELRSATYVKSTEFRKLDHGAGIVSGVLRIGVDVQQLEASVQAAKHK